MTRSKGGEKIVTKICSYGETRQVPFLVLHCHLDANTSRLSYVVLSVTMFLCCFVLYIVFAVLFYSVVLCYATLCSVVTACFEDMTPVTHLHPERVTDCVPVSRLFAPSPCLDCSRLEITLSLPHSAITSHSPLFPVGASRSYPSSPWYQPPPTYQHLASHLLFTCDQLFPLTTENLFWFSLAPLSTFCVHELVGLVWSVWSVC